MRKDYYIPMPNHVARRTLVIVPFLATALFLGSSEFIGAFSSQQPSSTLRAAAVESHEGVTISAQPWMDSGLYKTKFPKKTPFAAGIVAINTVFRNDSDDSMKVDLEQIRLNVTLDEDNRQALHPMTADDVADVMSDNGKKDPTKTRKLPLPIPSGGPKVGRDKKWTEFQRAAADAGVNSSIVAPHHSVEGLLYFDLQFQNDLLNTAHLYIPDIRALEKNHPLLYFEIDLSR